MKGSLMLNPRGATRTNRPQRVTIATAGQGPILVAARNQKPERVFAEGLPLGILKTTLYENQIRPLGRNARVLLYTDGLAEARNGRGEEFGLGRLQEWLQETTCRQAKAEELKRDLLDRLQAFGVQAPLQDDQTFLILAEENPEENS